MAGILSNSTIRESGQSDARATKKPELTVLPVDATRGGEHRPQGMFGWLRRSHSQSDSAEANEAAEVSLKLPARAPAVLPPIASLPLLDPTPVSRMLDPNSKAPVVGRAAAAHHARIPSDGVICTNWQVWRETDAVAAMATIRVRAQCEVPASRSGSRVILQTAVVDTTNDREWAETAGGLPVLILERTFVPPVFGDDLSETPTTCELAFSYREVLEKPAAPGAITSAPRKPHKYVLILPDDLMLPIEDIEP